MVNGLLQMLIISSGMFGLVLLALLFVLALRPNKKKRRNVKEDLKKIKEQINGDN